MKLKTGKKATRQSANVLLLSSKKELTKYSYSENEQKYISEQLKNEPIVYLNALGKHQIVVLIEAAKGLEKCREHGNAIGAYLNKHKQKSVFISGNHHEHILAFAEGMLLGNYQFLKYFKDAEKKKNTLTEAIIHHEKITKQDLVELSNLSHSVNEARDLVNEPLSYLTAVQLSKEIQRLGKQNGFKVEVFNQTKIESLKMGGLLAVNKGSVDPATFSILEWNPKNAKNKQPIILVGKGVVYDTGGLSLKPTPNSMDIMKCDMAGAAAMIGALNAIAANRLPVHVIALIPATDNRPGGNAYVPGDVVTMYDGTTVEVLNTDAEGRMLLADALAYAKKYNPQLVIDAATLTGAAVRAVGSEAIVAMGTAKESDFKKLEKVGNDVYERLVRFPFWEEYGEQLKSSIADLKNLGGPTAGSITAGKFLEHFTDYPYIHLDIAGPAWLDRASHYRPKGGTGNGVRLLYTFVKSLV